MTDKLVLTIPEAAERIGHHPNTVYELIAAGLLTARRLRPKGHLRILASDLAAFLAAAPAVAPTAAATPEPATTPAPVQKTGRQRVVRLLDIHATPQSGSVEAAQ